MDSDKRPMSEEMAADLAKWEDRRRKLAEKEKPVATFDEVRQQLVRAFATLPDEVDIPRHLTPEGERLKRFRAICGDEFDDRIDRTQLKDAVAFDRVAQWDGRFRGPIAVGDTGFAKTRAAWSCIGRLFVRQNRSFAWFTGQRLVSEMEKYEEKNLLDEFFRQYGLYHVLLVDDADKQNWQFESTGVRLFNFYDWVYRQHIPCITTTNKDREWWSGTMGEAFARRLFDDAHFTVGFQKK